MNLLKSRVNQSYIVKEIKSKKEIKNRLLILGLVKGTKIKVINKKINNDLIIKVRGIRIAISKNIAKSIYIQEEVKEKDEKDEYCFNRKS